MEIVEKKEKLTLLGRIVIPWAIKHRNKLALRYIKPKKRLLDIGCGNGYLLLNSPCEENYGIDEFRTLKITSKKGKQKIVEGKGKSLAKKIPFRANQFDYVIMIATIEHVKYPKDILMECHRILKKNGLLIMTTPKKVVESILFFLDRGSEQLSGHEVGEVHENYFDLKSMNKILGNKFSVVDYKRFQLGVNQLFVYKKK